MITEEQYNALVNAFREIPGDIGNAAKIANCGRSTASKAWNTGWLQKNHKRLPIKVMLKEEQEAARARRIEQERKAITDEAERSLLARLDAIQARGDEAGMSKVGRKNATNLAIVSSKLVVLVDKMVERAKHEVETNLAGMTMRDIRAWIQTTSLTMMRAQQTMLAALQIERIVTGEPIAILGVRVDQMTPEQMVEELSGIAKTLERAQGVADRKAEEHAAKLKADIENAKQRN